MENEDRAALGVLYVHGMGSQPRGRTRPSSPGRSSSDCATGPRAATPAWSCRAPASRTSSRAAEPPFNLVYEVRP
jgi:hypothetical protein